MSSRAATRPLSSAFPPLPPPPSFSLLSPPPGAGRTLSRLRCCSGEASFSLRVSIAARKVFEVLGGQGRQTCEIQPEMLPPAITRSCQRCCLHRLVVTSSCALLAVFGPMLEGEQVSRLHAAPRLPRKNHCFRKRETCGRTSTGSQI